MVQQRQMAAPAYLVGVALLAIPPIDTIMQILPVRMADPRWRYGAFGLLSNSLMLALAGFLIIMVTAGYFDHRRTQRLLGILSLVVAGVFVIAAGLFALDVLQLHKEVVPNAQVAYKVGSITAFIKAGLGIITLAAFGRAALSGPKPVAVAPAKLGTGALVMGSKSAAPVVAVAPRPSAPTVDDVPDPAVE